MDLGIIDATHVSRNYEIAAFPSSVSMKSTSLGQFCWKNTCPSWFSDCPTAVTPDQLQASLNSLQGTMNTDQIQAQLNGIQGQISETGTAATVALGAGIAGVKDAVVHSDHHSQMALCNLGHAVQSGFASVNQNILAQGAQSRELALQQALDAERARATELRIALSEHKNQAGHQATQVLLNQVISAKGA